MLTAVVVCSSSVASSHLGGTDLLEDSGHIRALSRPEPTVWLPSWYLPKTLMN